ncbi:cysteine-rich with EGF-like domain protein 2 isoform X2 [Hyposmocoma kahamanoa]|uniref:cysteine-rich with EGF-like domain protein 2 isoform X2 n=1 Tax=Hyposmocoma kahamanoa TaxID=1477025 RepID=UPI000E6D7045|nr:cysteine-rich with EGF-like domain protein 2 isoform X2 [Hyposmocoma kahamanoa]
MEKHKTVLCKLALILFILPTVLCSVPPGVNFDVLSQTKSLGDCQACKVFVDSFKKGLERTARGNYEGGDAAWEEENKKSYRRSEMRLVDILDGICKDVSKHSVQCHQYAEKAEEPIEQWWAQDADESDDLHTYICIHSLKVCCPEHHYGKDCTPCPGDHNNLCSGNGKCRGDGSRKGNGTCICDKGYTGVNCDLCDIGYYLSYKDPNKMLCSPCHISCSGACRGSTQRDCDVCKIGFILDSEEGCMDINECEDRKRCKKGEFCLNSLGSYKCVDCDKSCDGCHGDGPDMCTKCAKEFSLKGEFCVPDREYEDDVNEKFATTRNDEL